MATEIKAMVAIFTHGNYNISVSEPTTDQIVEQIRIEDKTYNILLDKIPENFHLNFHSITLPTFLSTLTSRETLERSHAVPRIHVETTGDILSDRDIAYYKLRRSWFSDPSLFESLLSEKRSNNLFNWSKSYDKKQLHIPLEELENKLVDKIGANLMVDKTYSTEFDDYYLLDGGKVDVPKDIAKGIFLFVEGCSMEIPIMMSPNNPKKWTPMKCYQTLKSHFFPNIDKDTIRFLPREEQARIRSIHRFFKRQQAFVDSSELLERPYYLQMTTLEILDLLHKLFPLINVDLKWVDFSCSSILSSEPEGMTRHNGKLVYPYRYNKPQVVKKIFQHLLTIPKLAIGKRKSRKNRKLMKTK